MLFITILNFVALATCSATTSPAKPKVSFTYDELYNLHTKFYDNFLYPLNLEQMKKVESPFFAPDVQGRVDVSRNFDAAELNTEYVFGLFADPSQVSFFGTPYSYEIEKFAGYENVAAASTRVWFNHTTLEFKAPVNIDTFIAFNEKGQIWQYDAVFK
ncbi:hypothetical protein KEM55_002250 [Ascosphaera atra]|nr:hypothetical protein KEM55_002250 [Ascosphaera atra]